MYHRMGITSGPGVQVIMSIAFGLWCEPLDSAYSGFDGIPELLYYCILVVGIGDRDW